MTDSPAAIPPGWYDDANAPGTQRWWDGTAWTEHTSQPYNGQPVALAAPAGTPVYTVWIWLIVVLPLLSLVGLFTIDFSSFTTIYSSDPTSSTRAQLALVTSPGYLFSLSVSAIVYGLSAWFAFLDWRWLRGHSVPRPFHFAWVFLSSYVYVIGRSVIVRRRTGRGIAPMWAAIGMYALSTIVSIVFTVLMVQAVFASISTSLPTGSY